MKMPPIRGPKALQDAWDKTKTVRQNYVALGLQQTLNPISSGGSEVDLHYTRDAPKTTVPDQRCPSSTVIPKGFGKIVRDESGAVVAIELAEEEAESNSGDVEGLGVDSAWVQGGGTKRSEEGRVIEGLEALAAGGQKRARHTSEGERRYLARLVGRYGDDYAQMGRDRRLNPAQKTPGELRRAVTRAGGMEALCTD